jgi:hypothetical protein
MTMRGNNHWTEVFYKELQEVEEYESSLAQAISPHKNREAVFIPKQTTTIDGVGPKQGGKLQKSVENTINCNFSVDSFALDQNAEDTCNESKHEILDEHVSPNAMNNVGTTLKQPVLKRENKTSSSSTTKMGGERKKKVIPKKDVDMHLQKPRKEKLQEKIDKGMNAAKSQKMVSNKCTTAIQTSDVPTRNPPAQVAIEIFKEKAEYRVISVSKPSPEKKSKCLAVDLASPKVHWNHQSNMILHQDHLCPKSKHDPNLSSRSPPTPLDGETGETVATNDDCSCCTSTCCSSVQVDRLLSVSKFSRHGSSMTTTSAGGPKSVVPLSESRNNTITSKNRLQSSPTTKTSKGKIIESRCETDQSSIVSILSEPTFHRETEYKCYHPDMESLDGTCGIFDSPGTSTLKEQSLNSSTGVTTTRTKECFLSEDNSMNSYFQHENRIDDEISMALSLDFLSESQRSSKLLDEMKKNFERTRAVLEDAKRIRERG